MKKIILAVLIILTSIIAIISFNASITLSFTQDNVTSFRGENGKITIMPKGGFGAYEYSKDNGITWQKSNTYDTLKAGGYKIMVRNKLIKSLTAKASVTITQPEATRTEVYVGVADNHMDQINMSSKWEYVRQNADGFYINFIELDKMYKQSTLNSYGKLFTNKNVLIESDMNSDIQKEQGYIDKLHTAGFNIPYTSLNYGWDLERQNNLKTYALKDEENPRLCFVQQGPWVIGGSITGDKGGAKPRSNADYRTWINQADGISTDGPMGLWLKDQGQMRAGSYSMVRYAHSLGKKALVMICPYGADVKEYNTKMFLEVGKSCVRDHEDNDAEPDIWSVFEYATSIAAVPEEKDGIPFNSTTGMAFYLIKHIKGDPGTLDLYATDDSNTIKGQGIFSTNASEANQQIQLDPSVKAGTIFHYTVNVSNLSTWCDYAAVLRSSETSITNAWSLQFKLGDVDITESIMNGGFLFYKNDRLNPQTTKTVDLYITRKETKGKSDFTLNLELAPHNGSETVDSMQIMSK